MTSVLLVRHGETDWNRDHRFQGHADPPLNDLGRRQGAELADRLAGDGIAALYSSDLRRAVETAEIVASRLGLPVVADKALREVDVGPWTGLTREEVAERFPDGYQRWLDGLDGEVPEGWEARAAFVGRVGRAVDAIVARHPGSRVVIVGHGGTIRAAERHAGLEPSWPIGNCTVVELRYEDGGVRRVGE